MVRIERGRDGLKLSFLSRLVIKVEIEWELKEKMKIKLVGWKLGRIGIE